ncbi:MAG: hypothetical protein ACRD0K_18930 [Egibacteraceae bacterium]
MTRTKRALTVVVLAFSALSWAVVPAFATPAAEDELVFVQGVAPVDSATGGDSTAVSEADAESSATADSETVAAADSSSGDANGGDATASNTAQSGDSYIFAPITCVAVFAEAHCKVTIVSSTGDVIADQDAVAQGGDGGNTGDTGNSNADADSQTSAESDDASAQSGNANSDEGGDAADSDADDGSLSSSDA